MLFGRMVPVALAALVVFLGAGSVGEAAFPGKNGQIAFVCFAGECSEFEYGVHIANPDGTGRRYIGVASGSPDWSADGKQLLITTARGIEVLDADGGNRRLVLPHPVAAPAWSPDGRRIVFTRRISRRVLPTRYEVHVVDADGSNETQLTDTDGFDGQPEWSPDGTKIAFVSSRDGDVEIFVMNADGSNETALTSNTVDDGHPDWSPDGSQIVFDRRGFSRRGLEEIFVMNADGSGQRQLTFFSREWSWMPAWSPNGRKIVFERGPGVLTKMNADGSNIVELPFAGDAMEPDWQRLVR